MATKDCFKGLIVGGLIGAALGILYAPKSGKETREGICNSADELLEKTISVRVFHRINLAGYGI